MKTTYRTMRTEHGWLSKPLPKFIPPPAPPEPEVHLLQIEPCEEKTIFTTDPDRILWGAEYELDRRKVDVKEQVTHITEKHENRGCEIVHITDISVFPSTFQPNNDRPASESSVYNGTEHPHDAPIQTDFDRRLLQESCVEHGGKTYNIYQKSPGDMKLPQHLDPEWIAGIIGCTHNDAFEFAKAWHTLNLDWKAVQKLINGYVTSGGIKKLGIKGTRDAYLPHFQSLAKSVPRLTREGGEVVTMDYEALRIKFFHKANDMMKDHSANAMFWMDWINKSAELELASISHQVGFDEESNKDNWLDSAFYLEPGEELEEPDSYGVANTSEFGTKAFELERTSCTHAFLSKIEHDMNHKEIVKLQQKLFPQGESEYPEFWYLTPTQASQVWDAIRYRKKKLATEALESAEKFVKDIVKNFEARAKIDFDTACRIANFRIQKPMFFSHEDGSEEVRSPRKQDIWAMQTLIKVAQFDHKQR